MSYTRDYPTLDALTQSLWSLEHRDIALVFMYANDSQYPVLDSFDPSLDDITECPGLIEFRIDQQVEFVEYGHADTDSDWYHQWYYQDDIFAELMDLYLADPHYYYREDAVPQGRYEERRYMISAAAA